VKQHEQNVSLPRSSLRPWLRIIVSWRHSNAHNDANLGFSDAKINHLKQKQSPLSSGTLQLRTTLLRISNNATFCIMKILWRRSLLQEDWSKDLLWLLGHPLEQTDKWLCFFTCGFPVQVICRKRRLCWNYWSMTSNLAVYKVVSSNFHCCYILCLVLWH